MTLRYVTPTCVQDYIQRFGAPTRLEDHSRMINWFCEGAITEVSNHILEQFENSDEPAHLEFGGSESCRCGSCFEFQIVDKNNKVLDSAESLSDWVPSRKP